MSDVNGLAQAAFACFCTGLGIGDWQPFLNLLSDDFGFWFPMGKYAGHHRGKQRAAEFFAYVSACFPGGLQVVLERMTVAGTTAVYEFTDHGVLRGNPYENRVALSLDFREGKVCAYREYFGMVQV